MVKSGREYRWKKHDSVTISGNRWYRHSQSKGGYPVDFVMEFYYATFPEAVKMLIGEEGEGRQKSCPAPSKDFRLPEKNKDNEMIVKYLTESRELEKNLVMEWIVRGDIYEEKKHHNVVFIGRDADGIPRYAHCRGTGEMKYRGDVAGSDKAFGFCHRGTDNQLFVFEAAIDLLSFIQLFPKDWKKRSYLSLGGVSSVALMTFLSERPQITSVFLCLDNDQAGNEACEKLAGEISEGYSVIRLKPSRKDWNEILCDKNTDRKKAIAETITIKVPEAEELVPMLCYEDIKQTSVEWLWFPYIPFGKLTIIQGNPGEGKTYFAMMLTAACTNRKLFPNMEDIEPFNVIYQTAEDGMGDTIKPRLIEAGADLSRVMVIDDTEEALTLSDDRIEKAVRQNRVRLVIIDPVQAFIGADVDMNRANEVRPVFRKLGMIAEKTGCAIVLIGHLNKSSGTQSTYRGLGSIDIMAAVRSLIFIGKVRKDPTTRVLIHEKSSLAPPGETMAFKLGDEEGFRWVGAYEISADELLDGKEGKATETKLERGRKLIRELLADKKEISIRELDEKAKEQGISGDDTQSGQNDGLSTQDGTDTGTATENGTGSQTPENGGMDSQETAGGGNEINFSEGDKLIWPVSGAVLMNYSMDKTVYFSTLEEYKYNPALIIGGAVNDQVISAGKGIVKSIDRTPQEGTTVTVDMGNGYEAIYGQLQNVQVKTGDSVEAKTVLGYLAEPTRYYSVEGCNLYFEFRKDGQPIDPLQFLSE